MSSAYIDAVETKAGMTPSELLTKAHERRYDVNTRAKEVTAWLKEEYGVGHGYTMAFSYVLKNGTAIGERHVGTVGSHRDESATLRLDGKSKRDQAG